MELIYDFLHIIAQAGKVILGIIWIFVTPL